MSDLRLMKVAPVVEQKSISPSDFEQSLHSSKILLQSLITFENTYGRLYSDDNVISVAGNDKYAAVLKADAVDMTLTYCSSLVLDKQYDTVKVYDDYFIVYNGLSLNVISATDCAIISSINKVLRDGVIYDSNRIIEWQGSRVVISDIFSKKVLLDSDIGINISTAAIFNGNLMLILNNSYVMAYNQQVNAFSLSGRLGIEFSEIYYNNNIVYGVTKVGNYFTTGASNDVKSFTDCKLSKTSPIAVCGDTLVTPNKIYLGFKVFDKMAISADILLSVIKSNLNIYSLTPSWQRFVSLGFNEISPCIDKAGSIYFTNFSNDIVRNTNNIENIVKGTPENCNYNKVKLVGGNFICNNKVCGVFAEKVTEEDNYTMFRRIENGKHFYYFFTTTLDN